MEEYADQSNTRHSRRRRHRSRRPGPLLPTIWFSLLGLNWWGLTTLALIFLRPHPLTQSDYVVGSIGGVLGLFYLWVGVAVYQRRRYILDCAFVCAGLGLLSIPIGTFFSVLLISSLMSRKHDFTR